jgi:putative ABC transport system permease protein
VAGLITAAGGVYAVLAYTVAQRRREIALRMALGASPGRVARSIVGESLVLAVAGGTIGIAGAAAGSRFARSLLFGVAPQDPATLVTAVAVLLVVVVAASWLPARRAALIDPGRALRI